MTEEVGRRRRSTGKKAGRYSPHLEFSQPVQEVRRTSIGVQLWREAGWDRLVTLRVWTLIRGSEWGGGFPAMYRSLLDFVEEVELWEIFKWRG